MSDPTNKYMNNPMSEGIPMTRAEISARKPIEFAITNSSGGNDPE